MSSPSSTEKDDFSNVDPDQKEVLDEEPRSILRGLIAQLAKGTDLHRITLPTFVLEPRSMLERITDFLSHPELILSSSKKEDPAERFVDVVRYFISGWHIRPRGVKKPYNPVLGEFFRCRYDYPDGSKGFYISEQTSHHPPISSYYFDSPENYLSIYGELKPKSKFLVNSAATIMTGETRLNFTNRNEEYILTLPNVYVRGILFGTMILELGDNVTINCFKTGLTCDIEFKTKGYFSGSYNCIAGKIRKGPKKDTIYEISGTWTDVSFIKQTKNVQSINSPENCTNGKDSISSPSKNHNNEQITQTTTTSTASPPSSGSFIFSSICQYPGTSVEFFNVHSAPIHPKIVAGNCDQEENESRRQWNKVTNAIIAQDLDAATEDKTRIEDMQRNVRRDLSEKGITFNPRFFSPRDNVCESFKFRLEDKLSNIPETRTKQLEEFIFAKLEQPTYTS